jgi:hypothetical protein
MQSPEQRIIRIYIAESLSGLPILIISLGQVLIIHQASAEIRLLHAQNGRLKLRRHLIEALQAVLAGRLCLFFRPAGQDEPG